MVFSAAKWKREQVQDHKFDFVDIKEFRENSWSRKIRYSFVFIIVLKSVLVYVVDLYTAGILLLFDGWGSSIKPQIPISISKWIFVGSIVASFLLLGLDMRKAKSIIASRDISYTFTNIIAYRYYTLKSYSHYCFFSQINNSKKLTDTTAFFVFFTFKGWKRLVFAEAPRQVINGFTLYSILQSSKSKQYLNFSSYESISNVQTFAMFGMAFTVLMVVISATLLLVAFLLYIPLLCHIRGNLKEYCCHIIDKRIAELLKKQRVRRRQQAEKGFKKGVTGLGEIAPTLPKLDPDPSYSSPPYTTTSSTYPYVDPPPMMYNNNYGGMTSPTAYAMGIPRNQTSPHQETYAYPRKGSAGSLEGGTNTSIPYGGKRMSDSSQGVAPIYNAQGQPIGLDQYPPRPDSNNSNSAYSDTSTKYSAGHGPYQYPPQHKYPYQQMPAGGYNNAEPYGGGYQQQSQQIPYNYPNAPHSNQYYDENYIDDSDYNNYPSEIPTSHRTPARYQQNQPPSRPYK